MQRLQRAWLRRGLLALLLWPVSVLFAGVAAFRRASYRAGLFKSEGVGVPVIVVGGVMVGGTGKTPVVMAVVEHLRARGLAAGVISRGYGRSLRDCREVGRGSRAPEVGDEPLLIARACGVPVFVARGRVQAARALLDAYPATQVIVCDDGLQHLRLRRDIEICVFDERGVGNGWQLPAGPLREPWPRTVDLVLHAGEQPQAGGFEVRRRLAAHARRGDGARTPLAALQGRPLTAIAGIAKPQAFFAMLREAGLTLERTVPLPDHHDFSVQPIAAKGAELVCTHKDAVKLWRLQPQAWAIPLELEITPQFWTHLDRLLDAKLSSAHGSQTA
ncbi:MAG: tetraacyldisaccharide 4'-kinase [Ramlibacter sp.]|nr:tetraacyldisaccharide 4'-kinase [Ramlibacter sp.]